MVVIGEIYRNSTIYPKRLIDVKATLESKTSFCFVVPSDWDFHIISHTWTDGVRQFVKDCAAIMSGIGWTLEGDPDGEIYMKTIASNDFSGKSYYSAIMNFLSFLHADGVERVWLDAVSINQYDTVEMASEMHYMGAFYGLSKACYIAPHGIGSTNGFKPLDSNTSLPRWLSRVWTLQEYILPEKVYFLVEKFDDDVINFIKSDVNAHEDDKSWIDWDSGEDLSSSGTVVGDGDFSRRKVGSEGNYYFLGGMAYYEMMGAILNVYVNGKKTLSPSLFADFYKAYEEVSRGDDEVFIETLVKQIRVRFASSEEDRVLGILGLIGFKGEYELSKNQGLEAQVIAFAKLLFKQKHVTNLLINFAAAEYEGYEVLGISWAPDLTADVDTSKEQFRRYFLNTYVTVKSYEAVVEGVQDDGALALTAQVAKGTLQKTGSTTYVLKVGLLVVDLLHDSDIDDNLPIHVKDGGGWAGGMMIAAPGIEKLKGKDDCVSVSDISLVLLGYSEEPRNKSSTSVIMVCIPIGDNKLHKIGAIHPSPALNSRARKMFVAHPSQIVIGGVGANLTSYLHKPCQSFLKTLTS